MSFALMALKFIVSHWKVALVAVLIAYALYVWTDRAAAKARAEQLTKTVKAANDQVDALADSYKKMSVILAERAKQQQAISHKVGTLQGRIEAANKAANSAYGVCANKPLAPDVQHGFDDLLNYGGVNDAH